MLILFKVITVILLVQLGFAWWNATQLIPLGNNGTSRRRWVLTRRTGTAQNSLTAEEQASQLTICIPARNEASNIGDCLRSILKDDAGRYVKEILVLDDRSTDETAFIVSRIAKQDARIRLLSGKDLPAGWMGKSYACHQLSQEASGSWLLFLDADVRLHAGAIEAAMADARQQGSGLITGFPYQRTGTWMERLVVPMMLFTVICHLPIIGVRTSKSPLFVAAHGAFMLIDRDSYDAIGGHEAIKSGLVDDMALARRVKQAGRPVTLADVRHHLSMRMYASGIEVWHGYRKNIFEGVGRSSVLLGSMLTLYVCLYLLPPLSVGMIWLMGLHESAWWAAAATLTGVAVKWTTDRAGGQKPWLCLLMPVSMACLSAIAISSWKAGITGKGYIWKGRRYE
ncbi:glycosyltransferase family 2 protein [Paenibacillus chibensis]|uniref:Glycosyltransferase family 2 protein n=1 Tax=Paenibacillus chibensis TaxID=59846 RepID=A0ABU6Q2A1_9BACL|nr:glycosyltransferase family 2 protein [Paenibacillus chibensis]